VDPKPITLYFDKNSRAIAVAFMLEELAVPYTRQRVDRSKGEHKTLEYKRDIHPHGMIPALRHGELVMFEHGGICLYLADCFSDRGLIPAAGSPERMAYYQWSAWCMATLEPALADLYFESLLPEAERNVRLIEKGRARVRECCEVLSGVLKDRPFMLGGRFSTPDVLIGYHLSWSSYMGLYEDFPVVKEYIARIGARPALGRAFG
jgi:glutathione S-transferase